MLNFWKLKVCFATLVEVLLKIVIHLKPLTQIKNKTCSLAQEDQTFGEKTKGYIYIYIDHWPSKHVRKVGCSSWAFRNILLLDKSCTSAIGEHLAQQLMQHVVHHLVAAKNSNYILIFDPPVTYTEKGTPGSPVFCFWGCHPHRISCRIANVKATCVFFVVSPPHSFPSAPFQSPKCVETFVAFSPSHLSIAPPSLRYGHTSPAAARRDRCSRQRPRRAVGCQSFRRTGAASGPPSVSWLAKGAEEEHASSSNMEHDLK